MREPEHRPSSTQLAMRTTAGLHSALCAQRRLPDLPERIARIPIVGLEQPEPPADWEIDTSEFDLAQRELAADFSPSTPSTSIGTVRSRLGAGVMGCMSRWSPFTTPPWSSTAASTPPPTRAPTPDPRVGRCSRASRSPFATLDNLFGGSSASGELRLARWKLGG